MNSSARIVETRVKIVPVELREANAFVAEHHRHHKPVQGHRFSLGLVNGDGELIGVCTVGRPVSRMAGKGVLEVTRLCTDGTPYACSKLYGAAARVGKDLGYTRIQTFILAEEPGTSLRAAGWQDEGLTEGGQWIYSRKCELCRHTLPKGKRSHARFCNERCKNTATLRRRRGKGDTLSPFSPRRTDQPIGPKRRWAKSL